MDRFGVFVDGGSLGAAPSYALTGTPKRHLVRLDFARLRDFLLATGRRLAQPTSILRIYWYDASAEGQHPAWQDSLGNHADIKLRLGTLRGDPPRQKGVDTLLVRDLIILAQERSISDAVLLRGDEDLREAVAYAQERGVRVHFVIASGASASWTLRQEADTVTILMPEHFAQFTTPAHHPRAA